MNDWYLIGNGAVAQRSIESLFYQGKYSILLDKYYGAPASPSLLDESLILGALVFSGRGDEALALFARLKASSTLTSDQAWACRFFIMIHHVRQGQTQWAEARRLENSSFNRENSLQRFYFYQSEAFFDYYLGKRNQAAAFLNRSLQNAIEAGFSWGRILAIDMLSHIHFLEGKIQQALRNFETCIELAKNIGNENLAEAIHITVILYRARISIPSLNTMIELETLLHSTEVSDTYSRANVLLELSQQATLLGLWARAEEFLNRALTFIYQFSNAKQDVVLNMRWAYLTYCQGEHEKALNFLTIAKAKAADAKEESLTLSIWGFEDRLIRQMAFPELLSRNFAKNFKAICETHSSYFDDRIRQRESRQSNERHGEDPLGDAMDEIDQSEDPTAGILLTGLLGLLKSKAILPQKEMSLAISLIDQNLICSDRQSVQLVRMKSKKRLFQLLLFLADGKKNRAQIFSLIWKTKYVPHLHDSVLYTSIANLRKLLGPFAYFVETVENGYRLSLNLRLISLRESTPEMERELESIGERIVVPRQIGLNSRQLQLLGFLKNNDLIDTRTYSRLFKVSTATANRDLRNLARLKRITRQGRSRDIAYALTDV